VDESDLRWLLDRRRIHDLVLRYCRAIDRLDMEAVRACYEPGGVDHHTGFSGDRDEYVTWVAEAIGRFDGTMHVVANHLAEIDGDEARAESYGLAYHWGTPAAEPRLNFVSAFRYVDHLRRHGEGWLIRERWALREWTRALGAGDWIPKEGEGPGGERGRGDQIYVVGAPRGGSSPRLDTPPKFV
jgi:hypothetical protein